MTVTAFLKTGVLPLALLCSGAAPAQSLSWTVIGSTHKVKPTDSVSGSTSAQPSAARNEFEPFQLVLSAPSGDVSGVVVTASPLTGPGAPIPASEVRLFREDYLDISIATNLEGSTGRWPDALVPDVDEIAGEKRNAFPFTVPSGENRVVFVDVHVPQGQAAGSYSGQLTVTASGGTSFDVPITLTVWDFDLPSTSSLPSTFAINWDGPCVAHFGSYSACGGDQGVITMNGRYARMLLNHRISSNVVYTGPSATSSGYDWASWDAIYAPLFDGTDSSLLLSGAKMTTIQFVWTASVDHYSAWAQHFRQRGWFDRTFDYTCDEPPATCAWSDIPNRASVVHAGDPAFRTLVTTSINDATANGVASSIDILTPVINFMDDKPGYGSAYVGDQRPNYDAFLSANPNAELWSYQSCMSHGCGGPGGQYFTGWPSYMVDVDAVQNRAMEWMSFRYGIQAELYFETTYALSTAWTDQYAFGGNGDGTLFYPGKPSVIGGTTDVPVASYRIKMIREGMEDYEYLKLVSDLGDPGFAQQVANGLFADAYSANQPESALYSAREQLAQRILALKGSPVPDAGQPPPDAGQPAPDAGQPTPLTYAVQRATGPVTVDGNLGEFAGVPGIALSGATAGSPATATVQLMWDDANLYAAYTVNDGELGIVEGGRDGNVWNGDGIELMVDTADARSAAPDLGDYHLLVNEVGDLRDERGTGTGWDVSWTSNAQVAVTRGPSGYGVELAVPWSAMGVGPSALSKMGLDVAVNDLTSGTTVVPFDWAGLTRFAQPAKWGTLTLQAPVAISGGSDAGSSGGPTPTPDAGWTPPAPSPDPGSGSGTNSASMRSGCTSVPAELPALLIPLVGLWCSRRRDRRSS